MQGLWLHGNMLEKIPSSIGSLQRLNVLSLAGNCLEGLPHSIGELGVRRKIAWCSRAGGTNMSSDAH